MVLTEQKRKYMEKLSDENGIISALAFDQRGALKRLMAQHQEADFLKIWLCLFVKSL